MSVQTQADKHRDSAKDKIKESISDLHKCIGHRDFDEYNEEYQNTLFEVSHQLLEAKQKI